MHILGYHQIDQVHSPIMKTDHFCIIDHNMRRIIASLSIFILASPLGFTVGMLLQRYSIAEDNPWKYLVLGTLQAVAIGALLFVTFFEILPKELGIGGEGGGGGGREAGGGRGGGEEGAAAAAAVTLDRTVKEAEEIKGVREKEKRFDMGNIEEEENSENKTRKNDNDGKCEEGSAGKTKTTRVAGNDARQNRNRLQQRRRCRRWELFGKTVAIVIGFTCMALMARYLPLNSHDDEDHQNHCANHSMLN